MNAATATAATAAYAVTPPCPRCCASHDQHHKGHPGGLCDHCWLATAEEQQVDADAAYLAFRERLRASSARANGGRGLRLSVGARLCSGIREHMEFRTARAVARQCGPNGQSEGVLVRWVRRQRASR